MSSIHQGRNTFYNQIVQSIGIRRILCASTSTAMRSAIYCSKFCHAFRNKWPINHLLTLNSLSDSENRGVNGAYCVAFREKALVAQVKE